jgi:hypothetical protein
VNHGCSHIFPTGRYSTTAFTPASWSSACSSAASREGVDLDRDRSVRVPGHGVRRLRSCGEKDHAGAHGRRQHRRQPAGDGEPRRTPECASPPAPGRLRGHHRAQLLVDELAPADPRGRAQLFRIPPPLAGDDVAGDPEQPGRRLAAAAAVGPGRLDRGDEHVRGQVGGQVGIVHPPGDEPLHCLDVPAVEAFERLRVGSDLVELLHMHLLESSLSRVTDLGAFRPWVTPNGKGR